MSELGEAGVDKKARVVRALRPDGQPFDEVRIRTVPRFKTSDLSGDEWRISATIEFWRKGRKIDESADLRDVETAIDFLKAKWHEACGNGLGHFAGIDDLCDQEGCSETATVTYKVKHRYCNEPDLHQPPSPAGIMKGDIVIRKFCALHRKRGDSGFDDSDANYELLSGTSEVGRGRSAR